jgi:hypothetical protein
MRLLDVLRVIIRPNSVGLIATPKNAVLTCLSAAQKLFGVLLHLIISQPPTQSLVTKSPGTLRWKVPATVMARALKLCLQPTAPAEFANDILKRLIC